MPYFLTPEYPRTETDVFEKEEPQTTGTCYMTKDFALSTANRSSFWNQRRPFLVYWGNTRTPKYLQVRFLHDDYDFSSATIYSQQKENSILSGINFISNGGDKHISIDRLKEGKFRAKDLRLRFELGNVPSIEGISLPAAVSEPFRFSIDTMSFHLELYCAEFEGTKGYWEKGGNGKNSWIDFVFYSGPETGFDLSKMNKAAAGFTFEVNAGEQKHELKKADFLEKDGVLKVNWNSLKLEIPVKPQAPKNTFI